MERENDFSVFRVHLNSQIKGWILLKSVFVIKIDITVGMVKTSKLIMTANNNKK